MPSSLFNFFYSACSLQRNPAGPHQRPVLQQPWGDEPGRGVRHHLLHLRPLPHAQDRAGYRGILQSIAGREVRTSFYRTGKISKHLKYIHTVERCLIRPEGQGQFGGLNPRFLLLVTDTIPSF